MHHTEGADSQSYGGAMRPIPTKSQVKDEYEKTVSWLKNTHHVQRDDDYNLETLLELIRERISTQLRGVWDSATIPELLMIAELIMGVIDSKKIAPTQPTEHTKKKKIREQAAKIPQ